MNLLTRRAPDHVTIAGARCAIRTDFRVSIRFEQLVTRGDLADEALVDAVLSLYYDRPPADKLAAANAALWFYRCGETAKNAGTVAGQGGSSRKLYDWEFDAGHVFAAFLADYGIDLESVEQLHWWKFRALFEALRADNTIRQIMEYRGTDISKLKGEQRRHCERMQQLYAIPVRAAERQKLDTIAAALKSSGRLQ